MEQITKLCIITTLLGIILLIIVSDKIEAPTSTISSITKQDLNQEVKLRGTIKASINKETIAFLDLEDSTGVISIVLFKPQNTKITKGSFAEVTGKVSLYEEKLQVYAETVKILN